MHIRNLLPIALAAIGAAGLLAQQQSQARQETLANRILRMSEADQVAYVKSRLDQGLAVVESDAIDVLILGRSSLVLPIMERKIEEVLKSPSPSDCFTDKTVDPQKFVDLAAWSIPYAGDEQALRELSKLIALNETRFGMLVRNTLAEAQILRNPFMVAYRGFEIGDPAIDKRIIEWIEPQFDNKTQFRQGQLKHWWAEAMAEKYGVVPTEVHWTNDPIASRLKPALAASLHDEILRLAADAIAARSQK